MTRKEIFSHNLTSILESTQKSQIEVAKDIGVSQQTFNTWCRGIAIPRMDKIQALADYFNVQMSELIESASELSSSRSDNIEKAIELYRVIENLPAEKQIALQNYIRFLQSDS